uniref:Leucine-binding protein domain-containing protein n=1 Tax=Candidatus Methanophaga sp. ANME-1 ERB7 TaxID=2759913 RepID=A0A7G9Z5T1_9EURY|nr:hypothetical protein JLLEDACL_00014 [Methanosarcinales archaeon ANME-1 ERB7]
MKKATKIAVTLVLVAVLLAVVSSFLWVKEEPKEVRFGCALSLSGELEEEGCLTKEGYELWKEHVNSQGGIFIGNDRYLINILYYDDESNPQKTASLVEKLITEDKVDFLLGPYGSSATFEAAALAEKYRVPMVEGEGPAEKIFTQGFKYTFGLLSSSRDYFQNILEGAALFEPKPNRVAILSTDVPYLYVAEGAEQHAKRLGFEVIPIITVEKGDDLSSILSDLKDDSPNMVLFSAPFGEALSFVKTAKAVGLSPKMFGIIVAPCDPAFVEQLGKDADYIFGPCQWTSNLPYDGPVFGSSEDYARLFRDKFGKEPEYHSAAATACGVTYQLALEKASSLDREDVRDALGSLDAMTFYGRIKFNEQGRDIYNPMVAIQVQRGKRVTVWPEHLATGSAIYPTPPWEEREIKIGAIYPLTGSLATTGADIKNGVLFAVDIINNEHKIDLPLAISKGIDSLDGAKIEIVFGDSQGSPSVGKSEVERRIDEEKVVALIGCYQSAVTAEASQAAEDKGMPFLTATSDAPSLTQRGFNWFFRTTPNDETFVQNFYQFLQDIRGEKGIKVEKLGIVYENSLWGLEFSKYAEQYAEEYSYPVVENISYDSDTTNVTNEVQRLKDANPDVVMQASYINDAILYMQTYKDMNFSPDAILADDGGFIAPEFLQTLGDDGNYILTRATWSKDLAEAKPLVETVNQMFRERYGANMTGNSARAFTGMLVLADAINRAGSTDPEKIRKALLETNLSSDEIIMPWDGVMFDRETHQNILGKGIICQIIDQEYYTVWPWNLATKELIWPMPRWEEREQVR